MDCSMPFMDGFEATKQIRSMFNAKGIPLTAQPYIAGVTGYDHQEFTDQALADGMNRVIQKPLPIIELAKLLV